MLKILRTEKQLVTPKGLIICKKDTQYYDVTALEVESY